MLIGGHMSETIAVWGKLTLGTTDLDGIIVTHKEGDLGSGVIVGPDGLLIMNNGEISGNANRGECSGVIISGGDFKMYGGTIVKNTITESGFGGGVYITSGSFEMYGGTIADNTAV